MAAAAASPGTPATTMPCLTPFMLHAEGDDDVDDDAGGKAPAQDGFQQTLERGDLVLKQGECPPAAAVVT